LVKFVHAADIHLDSPLRGLARYDSAPLERLRGATRRALENLTELCIQEEAELLLIAGDLYDGDWKDYNTGLFFIRQMARLQEVGTKVVLVRGNHDAACQISKKLRLPKNCKELSVKSPETVTFPDFGVAVHGQGFGEAEVFEDLSARYPDPIKGFFNIGLLHTALSGREGHLPYAPCQIDGLKARGYDYWALGHVHNREIVHKEPWIVFPGNLQGRHARETGAKGASLIELVDGRLRRCEHRNLDVVRWHQIDIDIAKIESEDELLDSARSAMRTCIDASDDGLAAARLTILGAGPLHSRLSRDEESIASNIRAQAAELGELFIEKIRFKSRAALDFDALRQRQDALGSLLRGMDALRKSPEALSAIANIALAELDGKIPRELRESEFDPKDPEILSSILEEVEQWLAPRVLGDNPES
jgi:exonuclease SbcD